MWSCFKCSQIVHEVHQHDLPPDEDDYGGDDGGEEHEPAEHSQSYNASCRVHNTQLHIKTN